ncbi:hypothetical protein CJ255_03295 [Candidatus Viridilinea mediisalina]|uniref:Peptidase C14 caspase domain-containing protein n=2 Tax=Candidatus Viridilinea mediisalina TaxID=2024553 RepID=A0A2A6RNB2_9CHLR|nr:hypothetical protein CJ255_03295 [Candidatus Viridilinea mediisalina]
MLLNHLFVLSRLQPAQDPTRYQHTLLLAALICKRLDRWSPGSSWPPTRWPEVQWRNPKPASVAVSTPPPPRKLTPTPFTPGAAHALLIGVGGDLPNTIQDAQGLYNTLTDPQRCAYPPQQVTLLTGPKATRRAILDALAQLATVAQHDPQAIITVYFSGHGVGEPASFLLPYGYQISSLATTALSGQEFSERLQAIRASRLLLLLDCCHAGAFTTIKQAGLKPTPLLPELDKLAQGSGRAVIASSHRDEFSYAGKPYSFFTQALLEALAGHGASKADGYAYLADVAMYVGRVVPERTEKRQHPSFNFSESDNFALAYYAGGAIEPKPL